MIRPPLWAFFLLFCAASALAADYDFHKKPLTAVERQQFGFMDCLLLRATPPPWKPTS